MPKILILQTMPLTTHSNTKETSGISLQFPVLTSTNYPTWAIHIEPALDAQGVWEAISVTDEGITDTRKDKSARAILLRTLPQDIVMQVGTKKSAKEIWEGLKARYIGADCVKKARLQTLNSEFSVLKVQDDESVDDFVGKLSEISSRFDSLGSALGDAKLVKKLLNSLPEKYYQVVAGIEQFCDIDGMLYEEAIARVKAFEERIKSHKPPSDGNGKLLLTYEEWEEKHKVSSDGELGFTSSRGRGSR